MDVNSNPPYEGIIKGGKYEPQYFVGVKIQMLPHHAYKPIPEYHSKGASGIDLVACQGEDKVFELPPNERVLIPCGFKLEMPLGFEAQVRSRSGMALKQGLVVAQGIGTIDSDYRGEVGVILHNISGQFRSVWRGDRIAQLVFALAFRADFSLSTQLSDTERGDGGYGSTGF